MTPLHTLTRWLTPWRTIRRLEAENRALVDTIANPTLTGIAIHDGNPTLDGFGPGPELLAGMFLGLLKEHPEAVNYLEITYGSSQGPVIVTVQRPSGASPHELRTMAEQEVKGLQGELATAREALRRVRHWGGLRYFNGWDLHVMQGLEQWIVAGMTGPLPPLPDHIVNGEQPTTEDQP
jgi:hypothetical protein